MKTPNRTKSRDSLKVTKEALMLEGAAGRLEAQLDLPQIDPANEELASSIAIICHPHPLFGGTMLNKVVHTLSRSCTDQGIPALRFNYRGVGGSIGEYDQGEGETSDAQSALDYMHQRFPQCKTVLAGFSFGAGVCLRLAQKAPPEVLVTVAPPVGRLGVPDQMAFNNAWLLVQGGADDVVDPDQVTQWAKLQLPPPEINLFEGAGHFFHGQLTTLRQQVVTFLQQSLAD